MAQNGCGIIDFKWKRCRYNSVYKISSKGSKINTGLIKYVDKVFVGNEFSNNSKIMVLVLIVSNLFLWVTQRHYTNHTTIKYHL